MPRLWFIVSVFANLLAIVIDILVVHRQILPQGWIGPGDFHIFRDGARAVLAHSNAVGELQYPPPFLLLATPFALLPANPGTLLWDAAGLLTLVLCGLRAGLRPGLLLLGCVSPPVLYCLAMGETGLFISSALLLALCLLEEAPILAGIAAGCVVVKPQFAFLLPVCFIAARQWRGVAAAAITAGLLCLLPVLIFGPWVGRLFFSIELHTALNDAAAPSALQQHMMVTPYVFFRTLGMADRLSGLCQLLVSIGAGVACWRVWSGAGRFGVAGRAAVTTCLIFLATSFGYIYDMPVLALALLRYAAARGWRWQAAIMLFWGFTGLYGFISTFAWPAGAGLVLLLVLIIWPSQKNPPEGGFFS